MQRGKNGKNLISSTEVHWYNTQFLLYPQIWVDEIKFLPFYTCDEQWALHVVISGKVCYIYICIFSTIFYAIFSISDTCLRSRKSISKRNFDKISQSTAEIKLLMVWKNRRPPFLKFYFRFRFWRMCSHRRVILHLSSKFRRNRTIGVMTSYRIFKMAAIKSQIYSRLQV